jgi:ABC-type multidrug transport system ATPase subunit
MSAGAVAFIEAEGLHKVYGAGGSTQVVALREASFSLRRGEIACLVGPRAHRG